MPWQINWSICANLTLMDDGRCHTYHNFCLFSSHGKLKIVKICKVLLTNQPEFKFKHTIENTDADLWPNSFFGKSKKRYLVIERAQTAEFIVTDICLIRKACLTLENFYAHKKIL